MTNTVLRAKSDAGNLNVRLDRGKVVASDKPGLASLVRRTWMLAGFSACALCASAAVREVDPENGRDEVGAPVWATLAFAVENADENDEIVLAKGTHNLTEEKLVVGKRLTIRGEGEAWETALNGRYNGNNGYRYHIELAAAGAVVHSLSVTNCYDGTIATLKVSADAVVSNVVFSAITTYSAGVLQMTAGLATHCWVTNCTMGYYRLVYLQGTSRMENCYLAANTCGNTTGGVVELGSDSAVLRNCTIVDNITNDKGAVYANSSAACYNNLIWGNVHTTSGAEDNWTANGTGKTGNWSCNCTTPLNGLTGSDNTDENPLLRDDRMHFKGFSPCRGAADPVNHPDFDMEGQPRTDPSIGAFEYVPSPVMEVAVGVSAPTGSLPDGITLTALIDGGTAPYSYSWDFEGDGQVDATTESTPIKKSGFFTPVLTVTDGNGQPLVVAYDGVLAIHSEGSATYYVDAVAGVDDTAHGLQPDSAWKTLSYALASQLVFDGDEIVLRKGSHTFVEENLVVGKRLTIRGEGEAWETAIDGQFSGVKDRRHHLEITAAGTVLHSLSVTNCYDGGKPSLNVSADALVSNVVFTASRVYANAVLQMSAGLATHCWVTNCVTENYRLVYLLGTSRMENCYLAGNLCDTSAAGIVEIGSSSTTLRNCTIVDNITKDRGAVYASNTGACYNNLIWGNADAAGVTENWSANGTGKTGMWTYNCTTPLNGLTGANNTDVNPSLRDDRMHFMAFSPCRGAADPENHPDYDMEGQPRTESSIGAFEYVPSPEMEAAVGVSATAGSLPDGITLTALVGGGTAPYSYSWDFEGDGQEDATTESAPIRKSGFFTPVLTVTDGNGQPLVVAYDGVLAIHPEGSATYYVDAVAGADDAAHGLEPDRAWRTLSYALANQMVFDGDEIVLRKGAHKFDAETLKIEKAVTIRGEGRPEETSIDGQFSGDTNRRHHLEITAAGATLHSLSLTNYYDGTKAALTVSAVAVVSNVVFSALKIYSTAVLQMTAGLATHCKVVNCTALNYRLINLQGTSRMENSYIGSNSCTENPGGIVDLSSDNAILRNCTIAGNRTKGWGAVYARFNASCHNNIIWGNVDPDGATLNWTANGTGKTGKWASNCTSPIEGLADANNIEEDPLFSTRKPWRLTADSPCCDAGDNALAPTGTDIDGRPRIFGRRVDIGCSEYVPSGLGIFIR